MKNTHPFFCYKKNCQKSAWNTPEYLSKTNWNTIKKVIAWIKENDYYYFWMFVCQNNNDEAKEFFYRAIAWSEGFVYCRSKSYCEKTGFPMIQKDLDKLQKSLDNYMNKI